MQLATHPKWLAKLMETQKRKKFLIMIKSETIPLSIPEEKRNAGGGFGEGAAVHSVLTLQQYKKLINYFMDREQDSGVQLTPHLLLSAFFTNLSRLM